MRANQVSEVVRERESFKHGSTLLADIVAHGTNDKLRGNPDSSLTAFAELALFHVSGHKALISLFDRTYQYIVAEATSDIEPGPLPENSQGDHGEHRQAPLAPPSLLGIAVARSSSLCDHVILRSSLPPPPAPGPAQHWQPGSEHDLPVSVIPDTSVLSTLSCSASDRFYAGVPIQTARGINIGVLCIFDSKPRPGLGQKEVRALQRFSRTIMDHLEVRRSSEGHRAADRMVRGVGSFIEGNATLSGWQEGPNPESFSGNPTLEGALNQRQQQLRHEGASSMADTFRPAFKSLTGPVDLPRSLAEPARISISTSSPDSSELQAPRSTTSQPNEISHIFSKAANIIRESIEVEGVILLQASISLSGGEATSASANPRRSSNGSSLSSSGDDGSGQSSHANTAASGEVCCPIIGFSTSAQSSIDQKAAHLGQGAISEKFLLKLLRRNPLGKIYNFDGSGSVQSSDTSGNEDERPALADSTTRSMAPERPEKEPNSAKRAGRRESEGKFIASAFSGARSVVFFPLWDATKQRWFAGGFAYTRTPTRFFSVQGELSYLLAFSAVIMSEVFRTDVMRVDKAKTNILNSISHELRSPLHGVVLGAELLHNTPLNAFQGDILHSVEACGRTLLDTIDQLLDWSKVNSFIATSAKPGHDARVSHRRGMRVERKRTIEAGMMSSTANVNIDVLAEEVVETICAGHTFQHTSFEPISNPFEHPSRESIKRLDNMRAIESNMASTKEKGVTEVVMGNISVLLDIDSSVPWNFHTQPGALRRILMNLLGNSLKFTTEGFIHVALSQPKPPITTKIRRGVPNIRIVITDSGPGISDDFIKHRLFSAFSQEDSLNAGSGLGLSIVKQITDTMGGSIQIQSQIGVGTQICVNLPLEPVPQSLLDVNLPGADDTFAAQLHELKGLRVRLMGFPKHEFPGIGSRASSNTVDEYATISTVCRSWLKMQIADPLGKDGLAPDFLLVDERQLSKLPMDESISSSMPAVVICRNAVIARQLSDLPKYAARSGNGVYEFSSQPVGPRKLSKVLMLSFKRWIALQAEVSFSVASSSIAEPDTADMQDDMEESTDINIESAEPPGPPEPPGLNGPRDESGTEWAAEPHQHPLVLGPVRPLPRRGTSQPSTPQFLLVDDNAINLKILASYMKRLGKPYETAEDGQQALDAFRRGTQRDEGRLRCILMDISMPVMDGLEAARLIRGVERELQLPRCAIFALTGLASAEAQKEAFVSGIDLFLTKPVRLQELTDILRVRNLC